MHTPATTTTTTGTLTFDKTQNTSLTRIPANYRIQKRPIPHAPVASPYAGTHVPKIVYVGSKTPFMSAIKRVQKLLHLAERRAMAPLMDEKAKKRRQQQQQQHNQHGSKRGGDQGGDDAEKAVLEECLRKLRQEKVFIKATGRAIEKALALGSWFQEKAQEYEVGIRTGSVCVVDDIVRLEEDGVNVFTVVDPPTTTKEDDESDSDAVVDDADAMDTTMGNSDDAGDNAEDSMDVDDAMDIDAQQQQQQPAESKNQRRRRRRRDRDRQHRLQASLDSDGEPPESRTRWISMIEVAVSLK